jgi:hypothetical protein
MAHSNDYVETLARYEYGDRSVSLRGTEQNEFATMLNDCRSANFRWDDIPPRLQDAMREHAELVLGPAIQRARQKVKHDANS